jgi:hypothetical protein
VPKHFSATRDTHEAVSTDPHTRRTSPTVDKRATKHKGRKRNKILVHTTSARTWGPSRRRPRRAPAGRHRIAPRTVASRCGAAHVGPSFPIPAGAAPPTRGERPARPLLSRRVATLLAVLPLTCGSTGRTGPRGGQRARACVVVLLCCPRQHTRLVDGFRFSSREDGGG